MLEDIIRLIIAEARARDTIPLAAALREIMFTIQTALEGKIADLGRVREMDLPAKEKERIIELILQAD